MDIAPINPEGPALDAERLRAAVAEAGLTREQFADRIGVDARTVRRWLSGITPRAQHRLAIAQALGKDESDLWPDLAPRAPALERYGELQGAWAHPNDGAPSWRELIKTASQTIELCDYSLIDILETPGAPELLAAKASTGASVKLIIASLQSLWLTLDDWPQDTRRGLASEGPLIAAIKQSHRRLFALTNTTTIEARQVLTPRCPAILRFDLDMLVAIPLWGTQRHGAPILHLHHRVDDGLFDAFTNHFNALWQTGWTLHDNPSQTQPNPSAHPQHQSADSDTARRAMFPPYGRRPPRRR